VPPSRAFEWLKAGVITDAKTVVALLMLERMTESGQGLR
jgi:hypothetical protein